MGSEGGSAPQIRWSWIVGVAVLGTALITVAFGIPGASGWADIAASVFVGLGTTVFLAGFLFLLERRFTNTVVRRVESHVDRRIEDMTQPISARLDDLETEVTGRFERDAQEQDALVEALGRSVSYESIRDALAAATRLHAIEDAQVWVLGREAPSNCVLRFRCGTYRRRRSGFEPGQVVIEIEGSFPPLDKDPPPHDDEQVVEASVATVVWLEGESPVAVGNRLYDALQETAVWEGPGTFSWDLALRNLQDTIKVAMQSRRRARKAWHLKGALYQLCGSNWAFTSEGLESRSGGESIDWYDFGLTRHPTLTAPEIARGRTGEILLRRGRRLYRNRQSQSSVWRPSVG